MGQTPYQKGAPRDKKIQITAMSTNPPLPPSPNAPSDHHPDSGQLDAAFEVMFLDAAHAANGNFINNWGAIDTAEALALFGVDYTRLKRCILNASASVWGVPTMRPLQIKVCYCLLHPHHSNSLVVVHRTGGGEDTHTPDPRCDQAGDRYDLHPAPHAVGGCYAYICGLQPDLGKRGCLPS